VAFPEKMDTKTEGKTIELLELRTEEKYPNIVRRT